jgi:hypothetical protein
MDETLIYVSIISGLFMIAGLEVMTHNWFRKERFKFETYNLKKQNDLKLKKMAKELGIGKYAPQEPILEEKQAGNILSQYLPEIIKNLEPDQLAALADRFLPESEERTEGGMLDGILKYAAENPEIAKSFLEGVTGGKKKSEYSSQV